MDEGTGKKYSKNPKRKVKVKEVGCVPLEINKDFQASMNDQFESC
jgi:hypothetical protein